MSTARAHPAAVVQRQQTRDRQFLLPIINDLTETQYQLLLFAQAFVLRHAADAVPTLFDPDVADGVASVAATLETARKGIIYEHQAASIPAQRLATELGRALGEMIGRAGSNGARIERDGAVALRRIERAAREAAGATLTAAEPSRAWLDLAARLMTTAGVDLNQAEERAAGEGRSGTTRIIVP